MAAPDRKGTKLIATNRTARRDYDVLDTLEVGIMLRGSEVKSLRESKVQLNDAFARIDAGELWLYGMHLAAYSHSTGVFGHVPERNRKLLAHKSEILRWKARIDLERLAVVALSLYFKDGRAKLELGLAKGRRKGDHRQALIKKEADIEARRAISAARREGLKGVLELTREVYESMLAHALDGLPDEACGLFATDPATSRVTRFFPMTNTAASSQIYRLDGREMMNVEAAADADGLLVAGVMHSHTHTTAFPSPTDVRDAEAFDPFGAWVFIIVSLKHAEPALRAYRILGDQITEEPVVVAG